MVTSWTQQARPGTRLPPLTWSGGETFPAAPVVLSFDVEEHYQIEAAAGLVLDPSLKTAYENRLNPVTRWLLEQLESWNIKATFFIVGEVARRQAALVREIAEAGHEVGSHSWDHRRVHALTPASFREDVRKSVDTLEQITGQPVLGYRAPTFSIVKQTAWALEVLADLGLQYDSSIYPVWHDRYGVPQAPRGPFWTGGNGNKILEIPPVTLRLLRTNFPVGGGGYFRLLPLVFLERALVQLQRADHPSVAMVYFHPWEFDPQQPRLPLTRLSRFRTYVGIHHCRDRFNRFLAHHRFTRARDVVKQLQAAASLLPSYPLLPTA